MTLMDLTRFYLTPFVASVALTCLGCRSSGPSAPPPPRAAKALAPAPQTAKAPAPAPQTQLTAFGETVAVTTVIAQPYEGSSWDLAFTTATAAKGFDDPCVLEWKNSLSLTVTLPNGIGASVYTTATGDDTPRLTMNDRQGSTHNRYWTGSVTIASATKTTVSGTASIAVEDNGGAVQGPFRAIICNQ